MQPGKKLAVFEQKKHRSIKAIIQNNHMFRDKTNQLKHLLRKVLCESQNCHFGVCGKSRRCGICVRVGSVCWVIWKRQERCFRGDLSFLIKDGGKTHRSPGRSEVLQPVPSLWQRQAASLLHDLFCVVRFLAAMQPVAQISLPPLKRPPSSSTVSH